MAGINVQAKIYEFLMSHPEHYGKSDAAIISIMKDCGAITEAEYNEAKKTSAFGFGFASPDDMGLTVER